MPTIWHLLGSVLRLLQCQRPTQSPPGEPRHRRDREVVAEPPSLQGTGLQPGQRHPGPWAGEIIMPCSAMNSCLPAATCRRRNDCSVGTVKCSTWMLQSEQGKCFVSFCCCCCGLFPPHNVHSTVCCWCSIALVMLAWTCAISFTNFLKALYADVLGLSFITPGSSDHVNNVPQLDARQESDSRPLWLLNVLPSEPVSLAGVWLAAPLNCASRSLHPLWGKRGILPWD